MHKRSVVLGLGNLLLGDEGLGIHAMRIAQAGLNDRFNVEWVDGGVLGLDLLPLVEECHHLLVLDAIDADQPGGTLIEMTGEAVQLYPGIKLSEHQVGFQEILALARLRGNYPNYLHLLGVQPADMSTGLELSQAVQATLPEVTRRTEEILNDWLHSPKLTG